MEQTGTNWQRAPGGTKGGRTECPGAPCTHLIDREKGLVRTQNLESEVMAPALPSLREEAWGEEGAGEREKEDVESGQEDWTSRERLGCWVSFTNRKTFGNRVVGPEPWLPWPLPPPAPSASPAPPRTGSSICCWGRQPSLEEGRPGGQPWRIFQDLFGSQYSVDKGFGEGSGLRRDQKRRCPPGRGAHRI